MKKIFILSLVCLAILTVGGVVEAVDLGQGYIDSAGKSSGYGKTDSTTFSQILGTVVQSALSFIGVIFLALMVYAGFLWMTARGEEEEVKKAQKIIRAAVIGIVITLSAYAITNFLVPALFDQAAGNNTQQVNPK